MPNKFEQCRLEDGDFCKAIQACFYRKHHNFQAYSGGEPKAGDESGRANGGQWQNGEWESFGSRTLVIARQTGCAELPELEQDVQVMYQHKKATDELSTGKQKAPFVPESFQSADE